MILLSATRLKRSILRSNLVFSPDAAVNCQTNKEGEGKKKGLSSVVVVSFEMCLENRGSRVGPFYRPYKARVGKWTKVKAKADKACLL